MAVFREAKAGERLRMGLAAPRLFLPQTIDEQGEIGASVSRRTHHEVGRGEKFLSGWREAFQKKKKMERRKDSGFPGKTGIYRLKNSRSLGVSTLGASNSSRKLGNRKSSLTERISAIGSKSKLQRHDEARPKRVRHCLDSFGDLFSKRLAFPSSTSDMRSSFFALALRRRLRKGVEN